MSDGKPVVGEVPTAVSASPACADMGLISSASINTIAIPVIARIEKWVFITLRIIFPFHLEALLLPFTKLDGKDMEILPS